jgi:hypothetical protein
VLAALAVITSFAAVIDGAAAGLGPTAAVAPRVNLPVLSASTQFDITGFPQSATLDSVCVNAAKAANALDAQGQPQYKHCGGTVTLNGHLIVVPAETIVIMPAAAFAWEELFELAPAPYGLGSGPAGVDQSGLALSDSPTPLTTYEIQAVGNRVIKGGQDRYIAGLVHVSQQDLNGGAGYINYMDYSTGTMEIGGTLGVQNTGARVMINDPGLASIGGTGRYGRPANAAQQDPRFQVDQDNPTIASASGFPMCFPRTVTDPTVAGNPDDPFCPQSNRPLDVATGTYQQLFVMSNPNNIVTTNPNFQAPFEVGDYVTFAGTLTKDVGANTTFISAHTIIDNTSISTFPGTDPAYVSIEVGIIGTGGLTVFGAGEAAIRTRFEGMSTDETRPVYLYAVDQNPDGSSSDRYYGTIMPDPGTPIGAVRGRWRFRPPCATFGTIVTKPDKQCVNGPANGYLPPPREVRAVIAAIGNDAGANPLTPPAPANPNFNLTANGIAYGQYHAPIGEYIFPENTPGNPIVENNFNSIPFLAVGGYPSLTGIVAGVLSPWPSDIDPAPLCVAAVPSTGVVPASVLSGTAVNLAGSATGTTPTYAWTTTPAVGGGTFSDPSIANPVWTAPSLAPGSAAVNVTLTLTVSNACTLPVAATAVVSVTAPAVVLQNPTVNQVPPLSVFAGQAGTFTITGSDPNVPALTPLTFAAVQTGGPPLGALSVAQNGPTGATVSLTAGAAGTVQISITATNTGNKVSAAIIATVTVSAAPADTVTITNVTYRTGKQRLILAVTDAPASNAVLKLLPYVYVKNNVDTIFNPAVLGDVLTNGGGGLYTMTLVGAPQPKAGATITVKSSAGGSGSTNTVLIRN